MKSSKLSFTASILLALSLSLVACSDTPGPDPKKEQARVDSAIQMRTLFDKAQGDYAKLDEADKASYEKAAGGAAAAQKNWEAMKAGPPSMAASHGPNNP